MTEILIDLGVKLSDICQEIIKLDLGDSKTNIQNLEKVCQHFLNNIDIKNSTYVSDYEKMLILLLNASYKSGIKVMQLLERTELRLKEIKEQSNEWVYEEPHFVNSQDCMGQSERYWRVWAKCNGKFVSGVGLTKEQARLDCEMEIKKQKYIL